MADFNQATTSPTSENISGTPSATVAEGANNTGFGISPTYVNADAFAIRFQQATTTPSREEVNASNLRYLFAKPTDSRVVPMRTPLPTEIATRTVVATVSVGTENPDLFDLYYFED